MGVSRAQYVALGHYPNSGLIGSVVELNEDIADSSGEGGVFGGHVGYGKVTRRGTFIAGEFSGNWSSVRGEVKDAEFALYSVAVDLERKSEVAGLFKAGITRGNAAVYAIFGASAGWWTIRTIIDTSFTILPGATGEVFTFSRRRVLAGFKPGVGVTLFVTNQLRLALEATYTTYFKKARVHRVFNDQFILGADAQAKARARPEVLAVVLKLSWRLG